MVDAYDQARMFSDVYGVSFDLFEPLAKSYTAFADRAIAEEIRAIAKHLRLHGLEQIAQSIEADEHNQNGDQNQSRRVSLAS